MGRQIVYCEGCGNSLREDDFGKGKARLIDNRPFCTECRPFKEGEADTAPRRTSSGKVPAPPPRKTSTGAIPIVPAPPRRPVSAPASNPLPIIAGVGVVVLILIIVAVSRSSTPPRPPAPVVQDPPLVTIPPSRPSADPTPPPPPPVRDLPPTPPPRRDPQVNPSKSSDPLVAPSASEKLDAFIAQIKQRIQEDVRKERSSEILNMFAAALRNAGVRAAELEKLRADYLETVDEPVRRAALWSEWKITSSPQPGQSGLLDSHGDRAAVQMTHPLDQLTPARLEREVQVPSGRKTTLSFAVACHQQGDFELRVYVDGKEALKEMVGPPGSGWREKKIDLSLHAGKRIAVRLENFPNNWVWEYAYWHDLKITYE